MKATTDYYIGVDLGQRTEYTALAVVERQEAEQVLYHVRHLERFRLGTGYPEIVARVAEVYRTPPLTGNCRVVADVTAVGQPVLNLLNGAGVITMAVSITAGTAVGNDIPCNWSVPKRDLVTAMQVILQTGRLKVAEGLPEAATLVKELLSFQVKRDPLTALDEAAVWREGAHDDLVLAVTLPLWFCEIVGRGVFFA